MFIHSFQISSYPGKGKCKANSVTSFSSDLIFFWISWFWCNSLLKSTSLGPDLAWISMAIFQAWSIKPTMFLICSGWTPLVLNGGVPNLIPDGFMALLSPGTVFLFTEMPTSSRISSALEPLNFLDLRSTKTIWLSVPPVTVT